MEVEPIRDEGKIFEMKEFLRQKGNGTWRFESGFESGSLHGGASWYFHYTSVEPSQFRIRMQAGGGGAYNMVFNDGNGIEMIGDGGVVLGELEVIPGFRRSSATQYDASGTDPWTNGTFTASAVLTNSDTLRVTISQSNYMASDNFDLTFRLVSRDPGYGPGPGTGPGGGGGSGGGGGCNAGFGALALMLIFPAIMAARWRKQK